MEGTERVNFLLLSLHFLKMGKLELLTLHSYFVSSQTSNYSWRSNLKPFFKRLLTSGKHLDL